MPSKARITREMILEEAFRIAREEGADRITARSISKRLGCSTQPVLYHFASVEEIRRAVYEKADAYHSQWLMDGMEEDENPMLVIGMNYVRFAVEEQQLFRLLFQTDHLGSAGVAELMQMEEMLPLLNVLNEEAGVPLDKAREIFQTLFVCAHGYASLYANNAMAFDTEALRKALTDVFDGALYVAMAEKPQD